MGKKFSHWARSVASLSAAALGGYLILSPIKTIIEGNSLDNDPVVKEYLHSQDYIKRIDEQITKTKNDFLSLREMPNDNVSSNYQEVNKIPFSRLKALENIKRDYELHGLGLRYKPKVVEWANQNEKNKFNIAVNPILGLLCLMGSYRLFVKKD